MAVPLLRSCEIAVWLAGRPSYLSRFICAVGQDDFYPFTNSFPVARLRQVPAYSQCIAVFDFRLSVHDGYWLSTQRSA